MKIRKRKIWLILLIIVLFINAGLIITGKGYIYKAVYYNLADIDDYKIFANRIVGKSTHPEEWPLSSSYNKIPLSSDFKNMLTEMKSIAFLIIRNDTLYYEEYWDGYGKGSYSNSFSMAKSYIGTLVGIALREGKIKSLDQPVRDYIPEFNEGENKKITIRHLLMMSGGLNWDEAYASPFSVTTEAYYGTNLSKIVKRLKAVEEPGRIFEYKSGDTQVLSFVLEKATGVKVSKYAEEKLWGAMGAVQDALWSLDKKEGNEKAYCCLNSNARDFARLGSLYMHSGNWKGNQIVDSSYVTAALSGHGLKNIEGKEVNYYGYQIWLVPDYKGQNNFYFRGILGQYTVVIPEKRVVMVRLGNKRGEKIAPHYKEVYAMIDEANRLFP
jgi:CubicO group peptidase (beta-lactamase class C family)